MYYYEKYTDFNEYIKVKYQISNYDNFRKLNILAQFEIENEFKNQDKIFEMSIERDFLNFFELFLPHKNHLNEHLLEVCYVKSEAVSSSNFGKDNTHTPQRIDYETFVTEIGLDNINFNNLTDDISVTVLDKSFKTNEQFFIDKSNGYQDYKFLCPPNIDRNRLEKYIKLNTYDNRFVEHGTAAVSVVKNINRRCKIKLISHVGDGHFNAVVSSEENALLTAIVNEKWNEGNIILLELQLPNGYPLEIQPAIFQLIQLATSLGIIIIEPSGNSSNDFSNLNITKVKKMLIETASHRKSENIIWNNYHDFFKEHELFFKINTIENIQNKNSFIESFISGSVQSGAIIIGALDGFLNESIGMYDSSQEHIKLFTIGHKIKALKIDEKNKTSQLEYFFSHSSGASAFIAGMVSLIQLYAKKGLNRALNPKEIKYFLNHINSRYDNKNSADWHIPNFKKIIELLDKELEIDKTGLFQEINYHEDKFRIAMIRFLDFRRSSLK